MTARLRGIPGLARAGALVGAGSWGLAAPALLLWLGAMLATPGVEAVGGRDGFAAWIVVTVLLQAAVVLLLVGRAVGPARLVRLVAPVFAISFVAEAVGAATDLPFGPYAYTPFLQPQLLGVPLILPLAWLMLMPSAWAVGRALAGRWGGPAFVLLSATALTAWDLFLDPQMVGWGVWAWDEPGPYFGIPLVNFAGWVLVASLITAVARPVDLPVRPLLVLYGLVWAIEIVGLVVFWGLAGPAIVGGVVMGAFLVAAWRAELRAR